MFFVYFRTYDTCMAYPHALFIHCLYLAKLNPVLRIGNIGQLVERLNDDRESADSSPLYGTIFSSNTIHLLAYVFTGGDPQLE